MEVEAKRRTERKGTKLKKRKEAERQRERDKLHLSKRVSVTSSPAAAVKPSVIMSLLSYCQLDSGDSTSPKMAT